ncbi:MAG: AsmA family protein [Bryobacterales bacterium]|nr:AsmA family protein [Bryobacterales bacterium]
MSRTRIALLVMVALVGAAVGAPFLKADRFAGSIRAGLEKGIGRTVELNGPIRFSLIGRGFSIEQVVIHEDPKVGAEPFAYVGTLEATLRIAPLLRGRIEFARLHLVGPSVNLAKASGGGWNAQPLLEQVVARADGGVFPQISLSGARLNFRLGEWKSVYYLGDAELRVEAAGERELSLYLEGEPARTDRGLRGFGRFSGRGRVRMPAGEEAKLDLNLNLTRSSIAELMALALGRRSEVEGFFSGRARLSGPLSAMDLKGRLQLEEMQRFGWLLGGGGGPGFDVEGVLNLPEQRVELRTSGGRGRTPVQARLRGVDLMGTPRWAMMATVVDARAESVQPLVAELGFEVPGRFQWKGALSGAIGYDGGHGWNGEFSLNQGAVSAEGVEVASFDEALVKLDSAGVQLMPAVFQIPDGEAVRLEGEYKGGVSQLRMQSGGVSLQHLKSLLPLLAEPKDLPLLNRGGAGRWVGTLRLRAPADGAPEWTAEGEVRGMKLAVPGLAAELLVERAAVKWGAGELAVSGLTGKLGAVELSASFRERGGARRTQELNVRMEKVQAAELERLLLPALRRRSGFLVRTLGIGADELPEWMRGRRLQGEVRIGELEADEYPISDVSFRYQWEGAKVALTGFTAKAGGGTVSGEAEASLQGEEPAYKGTLEGKGLVWRKGVMEGEGEFTGAGTGEAFLRTLRVEGELRGRNVELTEDDQWDVEDATVTLTRERGNWRWHFAQVQLDNGGEPMAGTGGSGQDGRIVLELSATGGRARRLAGRVTGPAWEFMR